MKTIAALGCAPAFASESSAVRYSFWVFGLLAPTLLKLSPVGQARLHCRTPDEYWIVEPGHSQVITVAAMPLAATGPQNADVHFLLEVPGAISRPFHGTLEVFSESSCLVPVVSMDRETAVSSIVGAELPAARAGDHALRAQAIVARSFLAGTHSARHRYASFCDTTHCQFLRSPAPPANRIAGAVNETRGVALATVDGVIQASYSAACGGSTSGGERDRYLYRSVSCEICRELQLTRRGHGWGLCQEGAMGLARRGCTWQQILSGYFPNASLHRL